MMNLRLKPYQKEFTYSYTLGVFPTVELFKQQKNQIVKVIFHSKGETNSGAKMLRELCQQEKIPTEISDGLVEKLAEKENCYVIGVFKKYQTSLDDFQDHLVLVKPSDMGNLGTMIRTMVGFSIKNLVIIKPAVDIFHPKVIRSSMGAIFQTNFAYFDSFTDYQNKYKLTNYPFMTDGKEDLGNIRFQHPAALVFGNEGEGLDKSFQQVGTSIKISQEKNVDSLNLAVAVGIGLYAFYLQG